MAAPGEVRKSLEELATGNTGRLLLKYSWPALVAMTLNALYAVVDRMFIGLGCGVDAMAGLTLTMPLMMLCGAFGVFVGAGHSAVLSIKLGEGDKTACEKLVGQLLAFKLAFFVTLPPLVFFNIDTVLGWCGASRVTPGAFEAARTYLRIVLFSHLFAHVAFGLSSLQRAEGGAVRSMMSMVVGFGANMILDPIFIFGFGMGIAGAAWATNIAMLLSCLWALGYYWRGETAVRLRWRRIGFYRGLAARAAGIGLSPFLQHMMSALIAVSLQVAFARWMPDEASRTDQIASLGVFQSALILIFMPILGAQQGLQPIIGYNWGARSFRRVLGALRTGMLVTALLCVAAFVVQVVPPFPTWIARMFVSSDNPSLVALAAHDLQLSNCMIWCIFVNVVATTYFQSIGRPKVAIWLSMLRQGACLLPIIWILPCFMDDKALAIWLSMPVSDVLCNVATIPPLVMHARFLAKVRPRRRRGLEISVLSPHGFCAGVSATLEKAGSLPAPAYCLHAPVHSWHVVDGLKRRGISVVERIEDVPPGATVLFSAHGVSPSVRAVAAERKLCVVDATCPSVARVHGAARAFAERRLPVVVLGHAEHVEVRGIVGEVESAGGRCTVVEPVGACACDVAAPGSRIGVVSQTTLSSEEVSAAVESLRVRYDVECAAEVCAAARARQDAVRGFGGDALLVLGSAESSNTRRLLEAARCRTFAAATMDEVRSLDLAGVRKLGVTSGAATPEDFFEEAVGLLKAKWSAK